MTASARPTTQRRPQPAPSAAGGTAKRPAARPAPAAPRKAAPSRFERINRRFMMMQFGVTKRIDLFRMLASLLRNNITIMKALEEIIANYNDDKSQKKSPDAHAMRDWYANMRGGATFSTALAEWVTPAERVIIKAGEDGGRLPEALEDLIVMLGGMRRIRGSVVAAIAYPAAIIAAIFVVLGIFAYQVLPAFAQILPYERWQGNAYLLYIMTSFTKQGAIPLAAFAVLVTTLFVRSLSRWRGRLRPTLDLRPPYSLYRLWNGIGFLLALGALMRAGVSAVDALKKIRVHSNPWMRQRIDACLSNMNAGSDAADALYRSKLHFPDPRLIMQMRIYAKNSDFSEAIDRIARDALELTIIKIDGQSKAINMALLVVLTMVIGTIGLGLYALQDQVTSRAGL